MNKHRVITLGTVLLGIAAAEQIAYAQEAQGFAVDRFDPAVRGSAWFALDSIDFAQDLQPTIGIVTDYASKPLVLYFPNGGQSTAIVQDQLYEHVGASIVGWQRLRLGMNLPIALQQSGGSGSFDGTTYAGSNQAALGDLRVDADVRVVGTNESPFKMAVGTAVYLPTGAPGQYTGAGVARFAPRVSAAGDIGRFAYAASVGAMIYAQNWTYAGIPMGDELLMSASAGVRFLDNHILLGPEIFGRTEIANSISLFARHESPFEALLGAHVSAGPWRFGAAGGAGIANGFGSPDVRVLASVDYVPPVKVKLDRDGDEIVDNDDACPDVPGVATEDRDTNGCPSDRDGDKIVDAEDACPDVAGIRNRDAQKNGCPPPADRDGDKIVDEVDACPDTPGSPSSDPAKNGCPRALIAGKQIKILEQVQFETGSAKILPESDPVLTEVRKILSEHPEIHNLRVEGHTDNRGDASLNRQLSQSRAKAVAEWLQAHGVDAARLQTAGFGPTRPIDTNDTDEGRQANRRVEFHIDDGKSADASGTP